MRQWRGLVVFLIAATLLTGIAWHDYQLNRPRKFNPATFCDDQAAGHPQQTPPNLAIDCQGP